MNKKRRNILLSVLAVFCLTCIIGAGTVYYYVFYPQFHPSKTTYIYIDRNDTADSVFNKIRKQGTPHSFNGFKWISHFRKYNDKIHTGRYAINPGDNAYQLYDRLSKGHQAPINLTIGSVRTLDRLAHNIGKQLMIDSAEIFTAVYDSTFLKKMGYTKATIPCLFIPETYQVYWDVSVEGFLARMKKEHDKFWNKDRLAKAQAMGMTPEEVCTLASIVEEETNNNAEKPMVAGLYINRLHMGMPLQADPTVKFALQDFGLRRIITKHLKIQSPYNTYLNKGLPPGPIRLPSPKGVDSVLNYVKHNYVFMCAKEDFSGTHNFASNYTDHMINARKYWKALNKRKIFK